jgi:hypothetical protein
VRSLPEEPLRNACVGDLSVAENMALRDFDEPPLARIPVRPGWLRYGAWRARARAWIADYGIKTQGETAPIRSTVGRQRAARRAGARAGRRDPRADRGQPGVRAGLRGGARRSTAASCRCASAAARCCWSAKTWTNCWSWPTASW